MKIYLNVTFLDIYFLMDNQAQLFGTPDVVFFPQKRLFFKHMREDRGSKYSVLGNILETSDDPQKRAKLFARDLQKDSFFRKATHNSYAWRYERVDGLVLEGYTDDGEKGAGLCILREMRKARLLNGIIVVTRYYGGVKLDGDRFRHVIDATKYLLEKI